MQEQTINSLFHLPQAKSQPIEILFYVYVSCDVSNTNCTIFQCAFWIPVVCKETNSLQLNKQHSALIEGVTAYFT